MNNFVKIFFYSIIFCFHTQDLATKNTWILDKELSVIKFELPILLVEDVRGEFKEFDGSMVIDSENIEKNRAFFSVQINSMELNYNKYKELLLSNIFFDQTYFPIAILDTKKFTISEKNNFLEINAELQIKDIIKVIPLNIEINYLTNNLVQIKCILEFSRNSYNLGIGKWSSTLILQDKILINANLFLDRK